MPELPEITALAERLSAAVAGKSLTAYWALQFSALKTFAPAPESLVGRPVTGVSSRAKYLLFEFGQADGPRLALHLSQAGRVDIEQPPKRTKPKGAVVRFDFVEADGDPTPVGILMREFGTERKAGWWILAPGDDGPMAGLGPDPRSDEAAAFFLTGEDKRRIHTLLRDQRTLSGVGRGYADDILHHAQISPFASLSGLNAEARARLLASVRHTLDEALVLERRRTGGLSDSKLGQNFRIHNHAGTPCPRCGADLRRVSYESHEVVYCPPCQTGGKVLADRRLSRLIK